MSNMIPKVMREGFVDEMNKDVINSVTQKIAEIDLHTVKVEELDFASSFDLKITKYDSTNGFIVWFDTDFTLGHEIVSLKTSNFYFDQYMLINVI
jgi:2-phospho-L-lactate guanylyltransferase (CobY/MobA/RfbA family)